MRVVNLLSLENRKFGSAPCGAEPIWFSKNQEKTSGTLYSVFKEPDPEGCAPSGHAVLPA
jgi:hypothetical protein